MKTKLLYLGVLMALLSSCAGKSTAGIANGKLMPCPSSPNCVGSFEEADNKSYVEAFAYGEQLDVPAVSKVIIETSSGMLRSRLITHKDKYIHFEFRSLLGFVDDVEFYINDKDKKIDFRSGARLGYYDFKKNRNRYLELKEKFDIKLK